MKIKISDLKPNPFKKNISNGELNREQIDKIKSNIKELGFFGSLPVFKKEDKYFLIAGHHRLQALKEVYGKDFEVKCEVENYNEDQVFRGMVIENITQRGQEFNETSENIQAVEDYLDEHKEILEGLRGESPRNFSSEKGGNPRTNQITANDVAEWIDKNTGKVIKKDVIINYMNINNNLAPSLKKDVEKKHDKSKEERDEDNLNYSQAVILSGIKDEEGKPDHKEQKELARVLNNTREQRVRNQSALITQYKKAPEEVKEQIKKGSIDLADISLAITQNNLREKKNGQVIVQETSKKIDGLIDRLSFSISDGERSLKEIIKDIMVLSKYVKDMSEKQKARTGMKIKSFRELSSKVNESLEEIEERI
jgi:hypothetical protein